MPLSGLWNLGCVGIGNRSTPTGVERAKEITVPYGIKIVGIEFHSSRNHLKCSFAMLAEGLCLAVCLAVPEALSDSSMGMLHDKKLEIIEMTGDGNMQLRLNIISLSGSTHCLTFEVEGGNKSRKSILKEG